MLSRDSFFRGSTISLVSPNQCCRVWPCTREYIRREKSWGALDNATTGANFISLPYVVWDKRWAKIDVGMVNEYVRLFGTHRFPCSRGLRELLPSINEVYDDGNEGGGGG